MARPGERAHTDQFRLLVESVADYAIFMLDPDGMIISWNTGAQRIKGYTADEIVGQHFSTFYPKADVLAGKPDMELRVASSDGRYEEEGWRVRKDGTLFWANVVITALRDPKGELVGFAKVTRDLTERQKSEEQRAMLLDRERKAREEAERNLRHVRTIQSVTDIALAHLVLDDLLRATLQRVVELMAVDTATVLLLSDDETTLIATAAHGLEEEVERGVRIPVGRGFAGTIAQERQPIILNDVEQSNVLNPILREKRLRSLLGVPLEAHGKLLGVMHVGSLARGRFRAADVEVLEVVADRVAIAIENAQLFEAARLARHDAAEAETALRVRDEFLSVAAHELMTPLTAAKAASQLLTRTFRNMTLSPAQTRALETVDKQIARLARLASQLLDTVRLEAGKLELEVDDADLGEVIRAAVEQAAAGTDKHQFNVDAPEHLAFRGDALRLEQVLTNLLDNAVKFSPAGGAIDVAVEQTVSTIVISVRDHGIGVPREHRAKLFEQFYQAHPNRSGLGLGLYITRHIVERHGGTVYAEQPLGQGTRIVVSLPTPNAASLRSVGHEQEIRTA